MLKNSNSNNNNNNNSITVEPLLKDPLSKGQPLYKGDLQIPKSVYAIHFNFLKRTASLQGLVPKCPLLGGFTVALITCNLLLVLVYNRHIQDM